MNIHAFQTGTIHYTLVQLQREAAALVTFCRDARVALGAAVAVDGCEGGEAPVVAVAAPPIHQIHHLQVVRRERRELLSINSQAVPGRCVQEGGPGCRAHAPRASGKVCFN
jgi:hypothetical protein